MKIAIAGSGALGSGFGAKLFQNGYDVSLIDGWEPQVTSCLLYTSDAADE